MAAKQSRSVVFLAIPIIAGGIFVIDSFTLPGIVNGCWYFIPLLLSIYVGGSFLPFLVAALLSVLIMVGYFLSPMGMDFPQAIEGHFMSVCVLWVGALLISQHKRTVGVMRLSEERLRASMQHSGIGMTMVAPDGQWLEVNPAFCAIVGYTQEELLATNFQSITHPDDLGADLDYVRQMLNRQIETYQMEKRYIHKDGHTIWIQLNVSLVWGAEGKPRHFVSQVQDITERKQTEEALRQTHNELEKRVAERTAELSQEHRLLRTLIDNLPDGVYAKDAAGRKTMANPADLKVLGCKTEADAVGKSDFDLFPKEIAEKFWADDQKVIHGEPAINREEFFLDENGRKCWLLTSKLPLRDQDGKIVGLVGIGRNITEQKQAEEALRQSRDELEKRVTERTAELAGINTTLQKQIAERERTEQVLDRERLLLRTLIDNLPDAIYAKDAAGRKTMANAADLKNLRCQTEAEAIGKSDFDLFPKEIAEQFWADDQKVIQGQPVINREEHFFDEEGRKRWLLTSKLPLRDQNGKIVGLMGLAMTSPSASWRRNKSASKPGCWTWPMTPSWCATWKTASCIGTRVPNSFSAGPHKRRWNSPPGSCCKRSFPNTGMS
jgi:PAS domain S-box-containing protein